MNYARPLQSTELFDQGKESRVKPDGLKAIGSYTFRLLDAPSSDTTGTEFAVVVTDVRRVDAGTEVSYLFQPLGSEEFDQTTAKLNRSGFLTIKNDGSLPDLPDTVEIAYFAEPSEDFRLTLGIVAATGYHASHTSPD